MHSGSVSVPSTPRDGEDASVQSLSASAPNSPANSPREDPSLATPGASSGAQEGGCLPPVPPSSAKVPSFAVKPSELSPAATSGRSQLGKATNFLSGAKSAASSVAKSIGSRVEVVKPSAIAKRAKRSLLTKVRKLVEKKLKSTYETKVKFLIAADRRVPWTVRCAMHDVVDEIWGNITFETMRAFDKLIDGQAKEIEEVRSALPSGMCPLSCRRQHARETADAPRPMRRG